MEPDIFFKSILNQILICQFLSTIPMKCEAILLSTLSLPA
jgi:hypothetical protein